MLFFPEQCRHCELAPCMTASTIDGAIVQDEKTGAVLFTPLTAQLDGQAVREACPYDIPRVDPQTKQIHKCDFCNDRVHQGNAPRVRPVLSHRVHEFRRTGRYGKPRRAAACGS